MSVSPSGIAIAILILAVFSLFMVAYHQRGELSKSRQDADELQARLDEAIAQRDAERARIIEAARRLDEALTQFVNESEQAHENHEERMESLSEIDEPEAVGWLCAPVPDDVRRLLGCDTAAHNGTGSENHAAGGADAAMH